MKKQYWVRLVHADKPCTEFKKTNSQAKAYKQLVDQLLTNDEVRFGYVMTTDPWGECFLELLRRENITA